MPNFTTADGAELHYYERGPGGNIPLLFLHGWQADATVWDAVIDELGEDYRTIAVDLRGFGESSAAPGPHRVETFADDLSALVASLDLDPLVAIGHSMGAAIALRFAIDRPEAVEGLVLVAPVPADALEFAPKLDAMFRATIGDPLRTAAWLAKLTVEEPAPAVTRTLRAAAARAATPAVLESYESWTSLAFADEAATIETPTLVLAPSADKLMTPELTRERVSAPLSGSRLVVVENASHYAIVERPDRIAAEIERFVGEL